MRHASASPASGSTQRNVPLRAEVPERPRRVARARPVRRLAVAQLEAEAPVVRLHAAEAGQHADEARETARSSPRRASRGATSVGASSSRGEREQVVERAVHRRTPASRAARRRGRAAASTAARKYVGERHLRGAPRHVPASSLEAGVRVDAPRARLARSAAPSSSGRPDACASRWRTVEPGGPAGSSRSTMPSSAATSTASAVSELRHRRPAEDARRASPCVARFARRAVTTPAADVRARPRFDLPQRLHGGDTRRRGAPRSISVRLAVRAGVGYSRAVRVGGQVWVSGTAPIMPDGADPPDGRVRAGAAAASRSSAARSREAGATLDDVVRTRDLRHDGGRLRRGRPRARRGLRRRSGPRRRASSSRGCSTRAGSSRSRRRRSSDDARVIGEADLSRRRSPARAPRFATGGSVLDHAFGAERPVHARRRGGVHAARPRDVGPRAAHRHRARRGRGHELEPRINAELMQSVLEIATPVCRTAGRGRRASCAAARLRLRGRAQQGAARRLGRHAPVQPLRAAADHRHATATARSSTSCSTSPAAS